VINKDVNFLGDPSQLILLPGAPEAIRLLQERFVVIVVTNQSGIARGMFTEDNLFAVHTEMASKLTAEEVRLDAFYYCPHHPTGTVSEYSVECQCRKPSPGMLAAAAQDYNIDLGSSFLVGDTPRDVQAAVAVGVIVFWRRRHRFRKRCKTLHRSRVKYSGYFAGQGQPDSLST
jgi:D,D-heptose 1,7-bisphosphate phosphatase